MPLGILICFGYLIYIASIVSSSKVEMKKFNKYAVSDKRLESQEYATEAWSSVMCTASCQQRDSCNSVSFKVSTGSCKGYSLRPDDASATLVDEPGTQMFYKERQCTGWSYRGYCYSLGDDLMTWQNSKKYCEENGQKLVEIGDEDENNFIQDMLTAVGNVNTIWTGGNDLQQEGTFVWNDGDTVAYTQFAITEPNGGDLYDCIKVKSLRSGYWYDALCSNRYFPLCKLHM